MKKFALGALCALPLVGCEFAKASLDTAKDGLSAPPEAVVDGWQLTINWLITMLVDVVGGFLSGLLDSFRGALGI